MGLHLTETDPKKNSSFDYFDSLKKLRDLIDLHSSKNGTTRVQIIVTGDTEGSIEYEIANPQELSLMLKLNIGSQGG